MKKMLMLCLLVVVSGGAFADKVDVAVSKPVDTSQAVDQKKAEIELSPIFVDTGHSPFLSAVQAINENVGQAVHDTAIAYQAKCFKPATIGWAGKYMKSDDMKIAEGLLKQEKVLLQQCKDSQFKGSACYKSVQSKYIDTVTNIKCSADFAVSDKTKSTD